MSKSKRKRKRAKHRAKRKRDLKRSPASLTPEPTDVAATTPDRKGATQDPADPPPAESQERAESPKALGVDGPTPVASSDSEQSAEPEQSAEQSSEPEQSSPARSFVPRAFRKGVLIAASVLVPAQALVLHLSSEQPMVQELSFGELLLTALAFSGLPTLLAFGGIARSLARRVDDTGPLRLFAAAVLGGLAGMGSLVLAAIPAGAVDQELKKSPSSWPSP